MAIKEQFEIIKKNWLIILIALIFIFLLWVGFPSDLISSISSTEKSYSSNSGEDIYDYNGGPSSLFSESAPMASPSGRGDTLKEQRKITISTDIYTEVEQGQFLKAEQKLKSIIASSHSLFLQDYVERFGENKNAYYKGTYTIKVESSKLDAIVSQLKALGTVNSLRQTNEDITESYENLEIEINTEKQRLARYQKILEEAELVEDKIKLNDKIFDQERRIKYLEDSLKNADKQVVYSTIYLVITEKEPAFASLDKFSGSEILVGFINSFNSIIYMVVLLPYAGLIILIWLAIRWLRRRFAKRK